MKRVHLSIAGLLVLSACVMAGTFPVTPPTGYDQYRAGIAHGTIADVSYYSSVAGKDLIMKVYTPPAYNTSRKYGVIYCYQGIGTDPGTIFADWCCGAGILCDNLVAEGGIQPVIIVALDDQFNGDYSNVNDMTVNDAIPYVDSHYSTYADANNRGLYGYSWGGGYTFNVGCANLNTFHYLSPSAAAPNKAGDDSLFPNGGAEAKQKLRCLFLSWGQSDYQSIIDANRNCVSYCNTNGISHYSWEVPGQGHSAGVWRPALYNFLLMADEAGISDPTVPRSAYTQIEAESYNLRQGGVQAETCTEGGQDIGTIQNGSYLIFRDIDFGGGAVSFDARVASAGSGGNVELYLDSITGPQVGTCVVANTGGWQTWVTQSCSVSGAAGIHDLYVKFTGGSGYLFNINWWKFNATAGHDVGAVGIAGSAGYSNGVFTVAGAGAEIGGTTDAFRFVDVTTTGDCTIIARVNSIENIDSSSRAGIMIRESLNANAANAFVGITPASGLTWQYRSTTGGTTSTSSTPGQAVPCWVKLVRSTTTFTGSYSVNGTTWTPLGSATITMGSVVYVGLAVSSHTTSALCTATFDNMTAPNWPTSTAPSGLTATTVSTSQINLSWTASTNATAYNVKRATVSGGPYTTIAANVTAANYQDNALPGGAFLYYYVISAIVGGGQTPNSPQAQASAPWRSQDIGTVGVTGKTEYSNGVITIQGSGDDIWNAADAFRFVYLPVSGDCTITVRVTSIQNTDSWSKAGLMIRESLNANAANAFIAVTPGNGVTFQSRSSTGGNSGNTNTTGLIAPYCLKLVRSGDTFTASHSPDGVTWTPFESSTIPMNSSAYIGLAVTSHNNSSLCKAVFDYVAAPGWPLMTPPPIPTNLTAKAENGQVVLNWAGSFTATGYNVKRSTVSGGPYTTSTIIAANRATTSYSDTTIVAGTTYYYVVSALNSVGESANSNEVTPAILRAYLRFDESGGTAAADFTGNGWTGTLVSGPVWTTAGKYSNAIDLNGSNNYVTLPTGVVSGLTTCTISAWVYLDTVSTWSRIFDFGASANINMFLTPQCGSGVRFSITTNGGGSEQQITGSAALPTGVWTHVAVTLNGSLGILYVNGAEVGRNSSMSLNPNSLGSTTQNYIGKSQYPDPYLDGRVDDFRIYSGVLTVAEVTELANKTVLNIAPVFTTKPINNLEAIELFSYSGTSLTSYANDVDGMSTVTFSKVSGPAWLMVANDGSLSGIPGNANVGVNTFTVKVTDNGGLYDTATMNIVVSNTYTGVAGMTDLLGMAANWLMQGCTDTPACNGADLDGDADVDLEDFAELAFNWLNDDTLQLYLKLDETSGTTAADDSLYGRSGVLINGPTWSAGHTGGALSFDETNDYVDITGYQGITGTASRTCSAWIKTTATVQECILSWGADAAGQKWILRTESNGSLSAAVWNGYVNTATTLNNGQWHHVAAVLDSDGTPSANEIRLYIDGVLQSTTASSSQAIDTRAFQNMILGAFKIAGVTSGYFNGLLDDVRIYSRAFSAAEIAALVQ
jgi:enterochelin esterase-like enzyme/regulation of enolase protein 1 (concanavalin A-like superfamily)